MRISKKGSILLTVVLFSAFLGATWFLISGEANHTAENPQTGTALQDPSNQTKSAPMSTAADPGSNFILDNFYRTQSKDGKTVWEIRAKRGQYLPEKNAAKVEQAIVWIYRAKGEAIELHAGEAMIFLQGSALNHADASGGVEVILNKDTVISSDTAQFTQQTNTVHVPGKVKLLNERMTVSGKGMDADLTTETFKVLEDVETVLLPKKS